MSVRMNYERSRIEVRDQRTRDFNGSAKVQLRPHELTSVAACGNCGHPARMHVNQHGGCWQPLGDDRVCVCKGYVPK